MIPYFISNKDQKKLDLFQDLLFTHYAQSSKDLMMKFQLTSTTFRRYIQELTEDIHHNFESEVSLESDAKVGYELSIHSDKTINYLIESLKIYYIKNSSLYSLIRLLTTKRYYSVSEIAMDLNFSEPVVYKLLSQLKAMLVPFDVSLNFEKPNNFDGSEIGVRYFLFLIYWNLFHTFYDHPFSDKFPLEFINMDFLKKSLHIKKQLSKLQETKLKILARIISYRLVFFKKSVNMSDTLLEDIQFFNSGTPTLNIATYNINSVILENESILFNFLVRGIISDIDTLEDKQILVKKYENSNLTISKQVHYFLEKFNEQFKVTYTKENYIETYYLTLMTFIYIKHFNFNVDEYLSHPINENIAAYKENKRFMEIYPKLLELLKYLPFSHELKENDIHSFTLLIYTLYEINSKPQSVAIYIVHNSNIATPPLIRSAIKKVFNDELVHFVETPNQADIIISDAFEEITSENNIFYFENPSNKDTWASLFTFISSYIYNRVFK
ncbi:transcriptional regulator [Lactococcus garvieae]|uniref:Transcriptional regulator n=1 Tax=Lactococcus garvieae TaxID=1363 RepID=A0A6L2ZVW1_9LACT|nr:helix-turn-helix domain-containing protein [Lactococcus garvieae]GFO51670.1 transcriptional regulator [Lactococcus garvieae]